MSDLPMHMDQRLGGKGSRLIHASKFICMFCKTCQLWAKCLAKLANRRLWRPLSGAVPPGRWGINQGDWLPRKSAQVEFQWTLKHHSSAQLSLAQLSSGTTAGRQLVPGGICDGVHLWSSNLDRIQDLIEEMQIPTTARGHRISAGAGEGESSTDVQAFTA